MDLICLHFTRFCRDFPRYNTLGSSQVRIIRTRQRRTEIQHCGYSDDIDLLEVIYKINRKQQAANPVPVPISKL